MTNHVVVFCYECQMRGLHKASPSRETRCRQIQTRIDREKGPYGITNTQLAVSKYDI